MGTINKHRDTINKQMRKKKSKKCLDKHTTKSSIIYLLLFIEFPVSMCTHYLSSFLHLVLTRMNKESVNEHAQYKSII
jgi:hypothetical protein